MVTVSENCRGDHFKRIVGKNEFGKTIKAIWVWLGNRPNKGAHEWLPQVNPYQWLKLNLILFSSFAFATYNGCNIQE